MFFGYNIPGALRYRLSRTHFDFYVISMHDVEDKICTIAHPLLSGLVLTP